MIKYKISFDNSDKKFPVMGKDNVKEGEKSIRDLEIEILKDLSNCCAYGTKELKTFNVCNDFYKQLNDLTEDSLFIEVDDTDLKNLRDGFIFSAPSRPGWWINCPGIFAQIEKPKD